MLDKNDLLAIAQLIDEKLKPVHEKLGTLELGQKALESGQKALESGQKRIELNLANLDAKVDRRFDDTARAVSEAVDIITDKMGEVEAATVSNSYRLSVLDGKRKA